MTTARWVGRMKSMQDASTALNVGMVGHVPLASGAVRMDAIERRTRSLDIADPIRDELDEHRSKTVVNALSLGDSRAEVIGMISDLTESDLIDMVAEIPRARKNVQTRLGARYGMRFRKHCSLKNYRAFVYAAFEPGDFRGNKLTPEEIEEYKRAHRAQVQEHVREEQIDALRGMMEIDHRVVMDALLRVLRKATQRHAATPGQSAFLLKWRTDDDSAADIAAGDDAATAALREPPGGWPTLGLSSPWRPFLLAWGRAMFGRPVGDESGFQALADVVEKHTNVTSESISLHIIVALVMAQTWAEAGFPLVVPTHRLAAALMATAMPAELADEVAMPWAQFVVTIPNGLLPPLALPSGLSPLTSLPSMVGFAKNGEKGFWHDEAAGGFYLWAMGTNIAPIVVAHLEKIADLADLPIACLQRGPMRCSEELAKVLHGHMRLAARLVLGAMIELDGSEHRDRVADVTGRVKKEAASPKPASGSGAGPARPETFELRRDVKVDARPWVKALFDSKRHVSGDAPLRGVRVLVRGHHRRVAHGPGRLLRRWQMIEPFWNPKDERLPVAVRSHRIGGSGGQDDA